MHLFPSLSLMRVRGPPPELVARHAWPPRLGRLNSSLSILGAGHTCLENEPRKCGGRTLTLPHLTILFLVSNFSSRPLVFGAISMAGHVQSWGDTEIPSHSCPPRVPPI